MQGFIKRIISSTQAESRPEGGFMALKTRPLADGVSLTELMVAVTLIGIAAIGVFQIFSRVETGLFTSRNTATIQNQEQVMISYLYADFQDDNLTANDNETIYANSTAPADLKSDLIRYETIFGNQSRYDDNGSAKCTLASAVSSLSTQITFAADCIIAPAGADTQHTLARNLNAALAKVPVSFAVVGAGGRCAARLAIDDALTGPGATAALSLVDTQCLSNADNSLIAAGAEILFPRFVAYSTEKPERSYTMLFDSPAKREKGLEVSLPDNISASQNDITAISDIRLFSLEGDDNATVILGLTDADNSLHLTAADDLTLNDNDSQSVHMTGTLSAIRAALKTLHLESDNSFTGSDNLSLTIKFGDLPRKFYIDVAVN